MSFAQFMAWERSFEKKVLKVREKELKYQRMNYLIEVRRDLHALQVCSVLKVVDRRLSTPSGKPLR